MSKKLSVIFQCQFKICLLMCIVIICSISCKPRQVLSNTTKPASKVPFLCIGMNMENTSQLTTQPWSNEADKEIGGIKLYTGWLGKASIEELTQLATLVKQKNLQVSVEVGGLLNPDWGDQIGEKSAERELPSLRRWRDVGGRLDQIELDGPERRAKGFASWGKDSTKFITDYKVIAREIDEYMALVANEFPKIRFILLVNFPNWGWRGKPSYHGRRLNRQDYGDYFESLSTILPVIQAAGPKFSGLMIDNPYDYASGKFKSATLNPQSSEDWMNRIADLRQVAKSYGLTCGLILNSQNGGKTSDEVFSKETLEYAEMIKRNKIVFDQAVIQSWYAYPKTLSQITATAIQVSRILQ